MNDKADIKKGKLFEYKMLRREIELRLERHERVIIFTVTTVAVFLGAVSFASNDVPSFVFLFPILIILSSSLSLFGYRREIANIAGYMITSVQSRF